MIVYDFFDKRILKQLHTDALGFPPPKAFWAVWETLSNDERTEEWRYLIDLHLEAVNKEQANG